MKARDELYQMAKQSKGGSVVYEPEVLPMPPKQVDAWGTFYVCSGCWDAAKPIPPRKILSITTKVSYRGSEPEVESTGQTVGFAHKVPMLRSYEVQMGDMGTGFAVVTMRFWYCGECGAQYPTQFDLTPGSYMRERIQKEREAERLKAEADSSETQKEGTSG